MKCSYILPLIVLVMLSVNVSARDSLAMFSIENAMKLEAAKDKLSGGVKFYFGKQRHGKVLRNYGNVQTNKKTNAFGKSDERACNWAFLSAMIALQDRAIRDGGNAVINIKSYYKRHTVSSETQFECGAGTAIAGVTFTGDIVKLAR